MPPSSSCPGAPRSTSAPPARDGAPWDAAVATPGGYAWWYFDALTPSGDGLVCILFVGAVFSPDYAARLRRGERALPTEHAAVNLALYRRGAQVAWVMSESPRVVSLDEAGVAVGGSRAARDGAGWRIDVDERLAHFGQQVTFPFGARVRGRITVEPLAAPFDAAAIAAGDATHAWRVLAPRARVSARFSGVDFALDGAVGYHDRNHGDGRLEEAFSRWGWARFHGEASTTVLYSFVLRDGTRRALWVDARDDQPGAVREASALPDAPPRRLPYGLDLPSSFGVAAPDGPLACQPTTLLEQAPFYARYLARLDAPSGLPSAPGLGEHLDLDRFRSRWNQFLLRFKTRVR